MKTVYAGPDGGKYITLKMKGQKLVLMDIETGRKVEITPMEFLSDMYRAIGFTKEAQKCSVT